MSRPTNNNTVFSQPSRPSWRGWYTSGPPPGLSANHTNSPLWAQRGPYTSGPPPGMGHHPGQSSNPFTHQPTIQQPDRQITLNLPAGHGNFHQNPYRQGEPTEAPLNLPVAHGDFYQNPYRQGEPTEARPEGTHGNAGFGHHPGQLSNAITRQPSNQQVREYIRLSLPVGFPGVGSKPDLNGHSSFQQSHDRQEEPTEAPAEETDDTYNTDSPERDPDCGSPCNNEYENPDPCPNCKVRWERLHWSHSDEEGIHEVFPYPKPEEDDLIMHRLLEGTHSIALAIDGTAPTSTARPLNNGEIQRRRALSRTLLRSEPEVLEPRNQPTTTGVETAANRAAASRESVPGQAGQADLRRRVGSLSLPGDRSEFPILPRRKPFGSPTTLGRRIQVARGGYQPRSDLGRYMETLGDSSKNSEGPSASQEDP